MKILAVLLAVSFTLLFQPFVMQIEIPAPKPDIAITMPSEPPLPEPRDRDIVNSGKVISWEDIDVPRYYRHEFDKIVDSLYIVYDDSRESRMLIDELERDWSSYDDSLEGIDQLRDNLPVKEIILVDFKDIKALNDNRIRNELSRYPAYRFGVAGDIKSFPTTAFTCDTWPLYTIQALAYQNSTIPKVWIKKVSKIDILYKNIKKEYDRQFLLLNNLDINEYTIQQCTRCELPVAKCECNLYYGNWKRNIIMTKLKKHPRYWPPVAIYPPKPETRMPWEYVNE